MKMSLLPVPEEESFVMAIIGRRGSGKGHLCLDLLKHFYKGRFDFIVWISPTFQMQTMCLNIEDSTGVCVFSEWRPEILHSLFYYMGLRNSGEREGREKEQCLLILDDVGLQGKKGRLSDQLDQIAFTSRHYGVSLIEMTQRITSLSTSVRSQLDALIMFREENPLERMNLWKNFGFGNEEDESETEKEMKRKFFRTINSKTREKYGVVGIRNLGGHFHFFDLNGQEEEEEESKDEQSPSRTHFRSRKQPRSSRGSRNRVQGVRDWTRYQHDLRRLSAHSGSSSSGSTSALFSR